MFRFLVWMSLAVIAGVLSANYIAQGNAGLFNQTKGQWRWWSNAGSAAIDPYTRYYFQSQNRLPLSKFETMELEARVDEAGRSLSADCIYELRGRVPKARWWTLAAYDAEEGPGEARSSMSAHDALYGEDGEVVVQFSRSVRSGNWIELTNDDEFKIILRLYGAVNTFAGNAAIEGGLPTITRLVCR